MARRRGSDAGQSRRRWVRSRSWWLQALQKEGCDRGSEVWTVHSGRDGEAPVSMRKPKESDKRENCENDFFSGCGARRVVLLRLWRTSMPVHYREVYRDWGPIGNLELHERKRSRRGPKLSQKDFGWRNAWAVQRGARANWVLVWKRADRKWHVLRWEWHYFWPWISSRDSADCWISGVLLLLYHLKVVG